MKKLTALFALALAALSASAALPQPDLIAQIYFAGVQKIDASPNVHFFTNEFSSPQALALRSQTADKLSVWLAGWLQTNYGVNVPDGTTKLRPLFDDLQKSEWMLDARANGGKPDVALAIKLDAARVPAWSAALKPFLPSATFTTTGGWLIFDSGTGAPGLGAALARITTLPHANWLDLNVNWPRLAQWFPALKKLGLPETDFTVTAPDANFYVEGRFFYPEPLTWNLEPWKIPVDDLHEPITSFTAVRGLASWLQSQAWAQPYLVTPIPNQAFVWSMQGMPFQTYATVPVSDPAGAMQHLAASLESSIRAPHPDPNSVWISRLSMLQTNGQVILMGLPMQAPFFQPADDSRQYLFFGGFPNMPGGPPSSGLLQQLNTKNLVYYHWEHTGERFSELLQPLQLGLMFSGQVQLDGNSAAHRWLTNSTPQFDNTITKITQVAPDQLVFNRAAPGLFTAAEFFALASWLEARDFPGCDLRDLPVRKIHHKHPVVPGATNSPAKK